MKYTDDFEGRMVEYFDLAYARHRIYCIKETGCPKPWTNNAILRDNYFCNVFRRIDKTTVWLEENVIKPYADHPKLWALIIAGRFLSRISTYEHLKKMDAWGDIMKMQRVLRAMQVDGEKIVTNAFVVNSGSSEGFVDKVTYLFRTIKAFNDMRFSDSINLDMFLRKRATCMQDVYAINQYISGIGPFMAYQYTVDFSYSERYLAHAEDKRSWMALGIGSNRGLNRMHGITGYNELRKKRSTYMPDCVRIYNAWNVYIEETIDEQILATLKDIKSYRLVTEPAYKDIEQMYLPFYALTMADVQHWLCEYDKYKRGGSKKRSYKGKEGS